MPSETPERCSSHTRPPRTRAAMRCGLEGEWWQFLGTHRLVFVLFPSSKSNTYFIYRKTSCLFIIIIIIYGSGGIDRAWATAYVEVRAQFCRPGSLLPLFYGFWSTQVVGFDQQSPFTTEPGTLLVHSCLGSQGSPERMCRELMMYWVNCTVDTTTAMLRTAMPQTHENSKGFLWSKSELINVSKKAGHCSSSAGVTATWVYSPTETSPPDQPAPLPPLHTGNAPRFQFFWSRCCCSRVNTVHRTPACLCLLFLHFLEAWVRSRASQVRCATLTSTVIAFFF